jgi:hypothetical protein
LVEENHAKILKFDFKNDSLDHFLTQKNKSEAFAIWWSKIVLLFHTYNFITIFYFLGIEAYPKDIWLFIEIGSEFLLLFDFFIRIWIRKHNPKLWHTMWLLQDKSHTSNFHFAIRLIGSIPTSFLIFLIFKGNEAVLSSFAIALVRCLKLLRLR